MLCCQLEGRSLSHVLLRKAYLTASGCPGYRSVAVVIDTGREKHVVD